MWVLISDTTVWMNRAIKSWAAPEEAATIAKTNITKAFELDSTCSEVYLALGEIVIFTSTMTLKVLKHQLKKVFHLVLISSLGLYGDLLTILGRPKEALEQYKMALELDPMNINC